MNIERFQILRNRYPDFSIYSYGFKIPEIPKEKSIITHEFKEFKIDLDKEDHLEILINEISDIEKKYPQFKKVYLELDKDYNMIYYKLKGEMEETDADFNKKVIERTDKRELYEYFKEEKEEKDKKETYSKFKEYFSNEFDIVKKEKPQ